MRNLLVSFFTLMTVLTFAQSKGKISGVVKDKDMGLEPLPFVSIYVEGNSSIGTTTDFDGNYVLPLLPGKHVIVYDYVGYKPVKKSIDVQAGKTQNITVTMETLADALDAIILTVKTTKQSEEALVEAQKEAVEIVTAIGAEELSKKGVGNVAAAVTKAAGVTKEENGSGSVFVRGLGDRYNVTTLNGLPLPSNNPATKNINLDIFSTDIVEFVGISKTFEVQNYADFGGANIDINSKKFSGDKYLQLSIGTGVNSNVLDLDNFYLQDGPNSFGFNNVNRSFNNATDVTTSWDRKNVNRSYNKNFSISGGGKLDLKDAGKINTFATLSFDSDSKFIEGVSRGNVTAQGTINSDFYKKSYKYNTNTTGMLTLDYKINNSNNILFTSLFLNSSSQNYSEYEGDNQDFDGFNESISGFVKRGTYENTKLLVNQLVGKNELNDKFVLNWGVGYNILDNVIPDRMQNTFVPKDDNGNFTFFTNSAIHNHRFFQDLTENEFSSRVSGSYSFNKNENDDYKGKLTLGYAGKLKKVQFESNQYSLFPDRKNFIIDDIHNIDNLLRNPIFDPNKGDIILPVISQTYEGNLDVHALFSSIMYKFNSKLTSILGVRLENVEQNLNYVTTLESDGGDSKVSNFNILPSLIMKYKLNEKQNMKLAFSQTYTLPQFKEKVNMLYEEVTQSYVGNPDVYASTNYNADLAWEFYPTKGALLSLTGFGKIVQNPINEVFINSASNDISYVNSGEQALAAGIELEFKNNLFKITDDEGLDEKMTIGINGSYIYQNQDLDEDKVSRENKFGSRFTFDEASLTGASEILANADISYSKEFSDNQNITATLTYSYFSDKLAVIGNNFKGNLVDRSVDRLDFILKSKLTKKLSLGLSIKNIFNPEYKRVQEQSKVKEFANPDIVIDSYKLGSSVSLSLNYKF